MENIMNLDAQTASPSLPTSGILDAITLLEFMDRQQAKKENRGSIVLKNGLVGKLSKKKSNKGYETDVFIDINGVEYPIIKKIFDLQGKELPYSWYVSEDTNEKPALSPEQTASLQKLKVVSRWFVWDDVVKTTSNMDVVLFEYKGKEFIALDNNAIDFSDLKNMRYNAKTDQYTYTS